MKPVECYCGKTFELPDNSVTYKVIVEDGNETDTQHAASCDCFIAMTLDRVAMDVGYVGTVELIQAWLDEHSEEIGRDFQIHQRRN